MSYRCENPDFVCVAKDAFEELLEEYDKALEMIQAGVDEIENAFSWTMGEAAWMEAAKEFLEKYDG